MAGGLEPLHVEIWCDPDNGGPSDRIGRTYSESLPERAVTAVIAIDEALVHDGHGWRIPVVLGTEVFALEQPDAQPKASACNFNVNATLDIADLTKLLDHVFAMDDG